MELTSLSTFPATYINRTDLQPEHLDEGILMGFAAEAAEELHSDKTCNHVVTLLTVKNYNAPKPPGFKKIVEIAFKIDRPRTNRLMYRDEVISWTGKTYEQCDLKITIECDKCHQHQCECGDDSVIIKVDDDWLKANAERNYWSNPRYIGVRGLNKAGGLSCRHHPEFSLMRPAQHKFFGADYHVRGCVNLDSRLLGEWPVEYKLEGKNIRTNVESGTILLSYLAAPKDDDGFVLVPNEKNAFDYLFWDVDAKMLYRNKRKVKEYYNWAQAAEAKASFYLNIAKAKVDGIRPLEWAAMMRNYQKTIPYRNIETQAGRPQADRFPGAVRRRIDG